MTNEHLTLRDIPAVFLRATVASDLNTMGSLLATGVVWHTPPSTPPQYAGPHRDRDAVLALLGGAGDFFEPGSRRIEIQRHITEGDLVAVDWRHLARTAEGFDFDNIYTFWFRVADGQITEVWENFDTGYLYGMLGLNPTWVRIGGDES